MSDTRTVSRLRQRMIEDMAARKLNPHTQRGHISSCKRFATWLKRSPDTATPDEVRRFQLHLIESGASICKRNRIMTGVRFLFRVTLRRHDLAAGVIRGRPRLPPLPQRVEAGGSFCGSLMCQTSADTSFLDAVLAGVFTVPGDGCVDFAGVLEELAAAGTTAGW